MPPTTSAHQPLQRAKKKRYTPDALMYVTVAFLWVSVWRFQDLWPIIGKLQIPIMLEAILAISLFTNLRGARALRWTKSRIFAIPFILLILMVVGAPFSLWRSASLIFIVRDFPASLLLMAAVAISLREVEDLNWIAFAHLIGACVYAIWIYLFVPIGSDGRLGELVYYDSNDFALLLVCTIPFAIYFLRPTVAVWKRLFALSSLALFTDMIIKSGSRGGFLALIVVSGYILLAFRSIPVRLRIAAVAAGVVIMTAFASGTYWTMMRSILHPQQDYNMTAQEGRKFVWKRGVGYMLAHPVMGVGIASFEQAEGTLSAISRQYAEENRGLKWSTAHNSFILVGAELGVPGLLLFVTMIGTSFYHLARIKLAPEGDAAFNAEDVAFAQTLTAALIGYCVAGFFISAAYYSFLYALIGLIVAMDALRRRRLAAAPAHVSAIQSHRPSAPPSWKPAAREHWAPTG